MEQVRIPVTELKAYLEEKLDELCAEYDVFEQRRGTGLMQGLVCREPVRDIIDKAMAGGLILINAGSHIIRFVPPLVITKQHVDEMTGILCECL